MAVTVISDARCFIHAFVSIMHMHIWWGVITLTRIHAVIAIQFHMHMWGCSTSRRLCMRPNLAAIMHVCVHACMHVRVHMYVWGCSSSLFSMRYHLALIMHVRVHACMCGARAWMHLRVHAWMHLRVHALR
jgi:hypothetical protein